MENSIVVASNESWRDTTPTASYFEFALLCGLCTLLFWPAVRSSFLLALSDDQYTHTLLALPVSAALIWSRWQGVIKAGSARSCILLAAVLVTTLCAARFWRFGLNPANRSLSIFMLVTLWVASFAGCFGVRAIRLCVFPLGFLFWCVPLPVSVLGHMTGCLQRGSSLAAWLLFSAVHIPVSREGVFVSIPGLTIEVAQECSSIRSSLMLLMTTMVLANTMLHSPSRRALAVAMALPAAVAKNGLRIFVIALLGTRVDSRFLNGDLHQNGGVVFFLGALLVMLLLIFLLRRGEHPPLRHSVAPPALMTYVGRNAK